MCRACGIRTERIEFADPKARVTRRQRQQIGVDCQSMPTSHAAVRHGVSWGKARRAEKAFLAEWDRTRVKRQPPHIGLDEIQRGKGQRFWTVLSDVVHGAKFHDLRREAGSSFLEHGMAPHYMQAFLDHANLSTTSRYLNITAQGMHAALKRVEDERGIRCTPVALGRMVRKLVDRQNLIKP